MQTGGSNEMSGWSWEQLAFALGPLPDIDCDDPECDGCMAVMNEWRKMRRVLGITHEVVGRA